MRLNQVWAGCLDYDALRTFYTALGLRRIVDSPPRYARFETPTAETFSIHTVERVVSSTLIYFECDDLDDRVAALKQAGITFTHDVRDERLLRREARLV